MINKIYLLINLIINYFNYILQIFLFSIFNFIYNIDSMPLSLKNIEFIRYLQTIIFLFIQTSATTYYLINLLKNIESNFNFFNKKFDLIKKFKKKFPKTYKKLEPFCFNLIKFFKHLRKFKLYNFWTLRKLKKFILPAIFIRYLYISKSSSAFINRTTNFLKKIFWIKPIHLILTYFIKTFYNLSNDLLDYLILYKKLWLRRTIINNSISYWKIC